MITRRRARVGLAVGAVVLALVGVGAIGAALTRTGAVPPAAHEIPASPTSSAAPSASARSTTPATPGRSARPHQPSAPAALDDSVPTRITAKSVGIDASFVDLGLTDSGELATPADPHRAGWFTGAHTPGGPGVAVVAGHVTWNGAKSAFYGLGDLNRGDRIVIHRRDGRTVTFAVDRMHTFAKDAFPTDEVYRAGNAPQLVLITCGGTYHRNQHYYDSNVIAWAHLVATS